MKLRHRSLKSFAKDLTPRSVEYVEIPYQLRAGGYSHWYVDLRRGLNNGAMLTRAAALILKKASRRDIEHEVIAGSGVAGNALAVTTASINALRGRNDRKIEWAIVNTDENDQNPKDGYGIHGAEVLGRRVLLVDDIGTTGSSLIETATLVRAEGGIVEHAINLADRSSGQTAAALAEIGVAYHALLGFDETSGNLFPYMVY